MPDLDSAGMAPSERTLFSLGKFQNGRAFKPTETRDPAGVPVIKIAELNGGISAKTGRFGGVIEERFKVARGDLLFAWSGSVGIHRYEGPPAVLNQHIFKCVAADDVDQDYFRYVLEAQMSVFSGIVEDKRTTMGHVRVADLKRLTVDLPELDEQRRVGGLLRTLDDRIKCCQKIDATIGELVVSVCHDAFTQRDSDEEITLPESVKLVNGGAYTKGASGTGRMVVRIKELNSGPSETTVYNNIKVPDDKTVNPGDVLFAWSGSLGVWRWYRDQAIVNQHIFKLIPNEQPVWLGWVHVRDALEDFQDIAAGKATTMGHITRDHLVRTKVPKLSAEELVALTQRVQPLWDYQLRMGCEVQTLKELRDFLLPRLLSGELRVAAAEEMAEAAS